MATTHGEGTHGRWALCVRRKKGKGGKRKDADNEPKTTDILNNSVQSSPFSPFPFSLLTLTSIHSDNRYNSLCTVTGPNSPDGISGCVGGY
jgi:hypothetical protein